MDYGFLIFAIVLVILMVMLYYYFSSNRTVLYGNQVLLNLGNPSLKMAPIADRPGSANYTISLWIYVSGWATDHNYNTIMNINTTSCSSKAPTRYMANKASNNYILYLDKDQPNLFFYAPSTGSVSGDVLITNNFPVQSWVFVSISVQGNTGDFYINGKLMKSQNLTNKNGSVCPPMDTIELGYPAGDNNKFIGSLATNNPNMYIANVQRVSAASNPQEVWTAYLAGNGVSSLNLTSYGAEFGLTQNGHVITHFST